MHEKTRISNVTHRQTMKLSRRVMHCPNAVIKQSPPSSGPHQAALMFYDDTAAK